MPTLKELRERAILSQSEVARACGVHRHTVSFWETGYSYPNYEHQRKLIETLRCTPEELLTAIREMKAARKRGGEPEHKEQAAA